MTKTLLANARLAALSVLASVLALAIGIGLANPKEAFAATNTCEEGLYLCGGGSVSGMLPGGAASGYNPNIGFGTAWGGYQTTVSVGADGRSAFADVPDLQTPKTIDEIEREQRHLPARVALRDPEDPLRAENDVRYPSCGPTRTLFEVCFSPGFFGVEISNEKWCFPLKAHTCRFNHFTD